MAITSPRNRRIKEIERLAKRRERDRTGLILIEGLRELSRAIAGASFSSRRSIAPASSRPEGERLLAALAAAKVPVTRSPARRSRSSPTAAARGAFVAVARRPALALDGPSRRTTPLFLVVDAVEKPGNLGALIRSADGAGAAGVIASDPATDLYNPNAISASLGTIFTVPCAVAADGRGDPLAQGTGVTIVTTSPEAEVPYTAADLTGRRPSSSGARTRGSAPWLEASDRGRRGSR